MKLAFLDLIRCPFCGGRIGFVESAFHTRDGDDLQDGILGCHCCAYPVVAGIPVFHLEPSAAAARQHIDRGEPALAVQALFGIGDEARAERFRETIAKPGATYREVVEVLGPDFEGGYFLYRFSDPTYVVAQTVVSALARTLVGRVLLDPTRGVLLDPTRGVLLDPTPGGARAIDVCGGSGHLTRALAGYVAEPVLADLYFSKLWLAKRFTAPTCQPVCCDGNAPLPFRRDTFRLAVCSDAFHYIWTKRLLASEMMRIVGEAGVVALTHVHNERQWNPSAGMPLPPEAYADLFEDLGARVYSERALLEQIVAGGPLDLSAHHSSTTLDADPALTVVAARDPAIFSRHPLPQLPHRRLHVNPLYAIEHVDGGLQCRLQFPSSDYADEYGAARAYLPDEVFVPDSLVTAAPDANLPDAADDLIRRRVLLDLPDRYL